MKILVIDGQGGGVGRSLVEAFAKRGSLEDVIDVKLCVAAGGGGPADLKPHGLFILDPAGIGDVRRGGEADRGRDAGGDPDAAGVSGPVAFPRTGATVREARADDPLSGNGRGRMA